MDYTLIHYHAQVWEEAAYRYLRDGLLARGWPVGALRFDFDAVIRGLIIDTRLGNIVKANRFGYIKRASHGMRLMNQEEQRRAYSQTTVSLADPRWQFMNTLFSLSEACMFGQLVDLRDQGELPGDPAYAEIYNTVRATLDAAHVEGKLKDEIMSDPARFVVLDPETPLALLDQKHADKRLLLITNSEWGYTQRMMTWAFDRYLPDGMTWKDLFEIIIVAARKPTFFETRSPLFEVVDEEQGLLRACSSGLRPGVIYHGGHAGLVHDYLGAQSDEILYVGDHIFGDINVSKTRLHWRTGLVLHDLEDDLAALDGHREEQQLLFARMEDKKQMELRLSQLRLRLQRLRRGYGPQPAESAEDLEAAITTLRNQIVDEDVRLAPLARCAWELNNPRWGLLMRAGNDKSHLARQVERYADIYMSRVSNFLYQTPFSYIRSHRGSLPHDQDQIDNPFQTDGPWSSTQGES
jgi:HAD superfamily 5'-nucleotidase-like hydrolase